MTESNFRMPRLDDNDAFRIKELNYYWGILRCDEEIESLEAVEPTLHVVRLRIKYMKVLRPGRYRVRIMGTRQAS